MERGVKGGLVHVETELKGVVRMGTALRGG